MRVLVVPVGSAGDVHPFVPVALELQARGHDGTVVTNGCFTPTPRVAVDTGRRFKGADPVGRTCRSIESCARDATPARMP